MLAVERSGFTVLVLCAVMLHLGLSAQLEHRGRGQLPAQLTRDHDLDMRPEMEYLR